MLGRTLGVRLQNLECRAQGSGFAASGSGIVLKDWEVWGFGARKRNPKSRVWIGKGRMKFVIPTVLSANSNASFPLCHESAGCAQLLAAPQGGSRLLGVYRLEFKGVGCPPSCCCSGLQRVKGFGFT